MKVNKFMEKKILDIYFIPVLSDIIVGFLDNIVPEFDDKFIDSCIEDGDYLYFNTEGESLVLYMLRRCSSYNITKMLYRSEYLNITHFHHLDRNKCTELSWFCYRKMDELLIYLIEKNKHCLNMQHFQNKDYRNRTELYWLCKHTDMSNTLYLLLKILSKSLMVEHFKNKSRANDHDELYWILKNNNKKIKEILPNFILNQKQ